MHINLLGIFALSIERNGNSVKKKISPKTQIRDVAHWKKALNKRCDKNFDN